MLGKALARTEDIVVQESGNELLIYDLKMNKAFCLNETSALVWQLCNGKNTVSEISDKMSKQLKELVSDDLVWLALDQFSKDRLLNDDEMVVRHFSGVSRRDVIRKVGIASVIALPIVSSIVAPMAASANSHCAPACLAAFIDDPCTGCTGNATFQEFTSTNGTCTGAIGMPFVFNCLGPVGPQPVDFRRN